MRDPQLPKAQQPTIAPGDLGAEDDKAIGHLIADTKLKTTQEAFTERYEKGITNWLEQQGPTQEDIEKGQLLASIAIEARRQAIIDTVVRSAGFFAILAPTALILNFSPPTAIGLSCPLAMVAAFVTEDK